MAQKTELGLSPIEEVIADAKAGKLFILVDDQNRENEGDLCVVGAHANADAVNFMAKYGRGLICLALTKERTEKLGLSMMDRRNESRHQTAFTVSIEARDGVTTGISAHDRARTIAVAIDPNMTERDITTPGHIFPLVARDGGTLVRAGHTEAVIDIARASGYAPNGVICEIMKDDGTMARLPDLVDFAAEHDLKIGAIADLIAWRRMNETLVTRVTETTIDTEFGGAWRLIIYRNDVTGVEHLVLQKGDIMPAEPVMVRMHALDLMVDLFGHAHRSRRHGELQRAMKMIADAGKGVIVLLREFSSSSLSEMVTQQASMQKEPTSPELRDYGVGAQILNDLNITNMILLTNSKPNVIGLEGYGLSIDSWQPVTEADDSDKE
jgi:3,4-dihydroxy 2-butanone 4-phosphate synthase/GTP cyclohydrolase II